MSFDIFDTEVSQVKRLMSEYSWTFYGIGGAGKSSLASKFPFPLFFQFEVGQSALKVKKTPPIKDWLDFKKHILSLEKGKKAGKEIPYRTFVIDTADVAWKYCSAYVCDEMGWEHPSDADFGKGWESVANEWFMTLDRLQKLSNDETPLTIINILHDKEKEIKHKSLGKFHKISPNVPKGGMAVVFDKVDFVLYFGAEQTRDKEGNVEIKNRYIRTRENGFIEAKSRFSHMVEEMPLGENSIESFKLLKAEFDRACALQVEEEDSYDAYSDNNVDKPSTTNKAESDKKANAEKVKADKKAKADAEKEAKAKADEEKKAKLDAEKAKAKAEKSSGSDKDEYEELEQEDQKGEAPKSNKKDKPSNNLDAVVAEIKVLAQELVVSKVVSSTNMKSLIAEHTSVSKISDINDLDEANSLLAVLKEASSDDE